MRFSHVAACLGAALFFLSTTRPALAVPTMTRGLTLPSGGLELRFGLGLGHEPYGDLDDDDETGLGLDLGFSYGLSSTLELGVRTGVRFGSDGRRVLADRYGRTFETEHYGAGWDELANPEIGLKFLLASGVAQLALDTRVYIPVSDRVGVMFGLPIALRLGSVRVDTGVYVPMIFREDTVVDISLPLHLWFAASHRLAVGPLTGVVFRDGGGRDVPLGLGLAYGLGGSNELRTWLLFPDISREGGAKSWGVGLGFALRF